MRDIESLNLGETIVAGAANALFTALLVGVVAGIAVRAYERRVDERRDKAARAAEDRRQEIDAENASELLQRSLEHQTRSALRDTYGALLVTQREARQSALALANEKGSTEAARGRATTAHDAFIQSYHRLALDATEQMWRDARALRNVLDEMLKRALGGDAEGCEALVPVARAARQNLERSLRQRLGYPPLQDRRELGDFDKGVVD